MIRSICIFCGSSTGFNPDYGNAARRMAKLLLRENITLVYGGANIGLMGILADTILESGGRVIGVMPRSLVEKEVAHQGLTEMHIVGDMQERKALMSDLSDAFITLPGAYGTLDELFEVLTWNQLNIVNKPVGLLNINGFFNPLLAMLDHSVNEKFLRIEHRKILIAEEKEDVLLRLLINYKPVIAEKWIEGLKKGKI